jgi:hypothetical protein
MAYLDWIKDGASKDAPGKDKSRIGKWDRVFAEIQHDEGLAKKRDLTGKEPTAQEGVVPKELVKEWAARRQKLKAEKDKPRRVRVKDHDIPF